jgi:hypothetical protein
MSDARRRRCLSPQGHEEHQGSEGLDPFVPFVSFVVKMNACDAAIPAG